MFCRDLFASDEAQHSVGSQTDPLGLVQTSKQKVWMTGTSAENTRVVTFGSNRGACQPATGTSPTGRGCGPWKSAWSAEHGRHYYQNKLTREAVWELRTVSRPSVPLPAMHDRDASGAHEEPEGRPAKRQRIPSPLTTIRSAEGHERKPAASDAHSAGASSPAAQIPA